MQLNLFNQLIVQREALREGQAEINSWLDKAENLLDSYTLSGGKEQIQTQLERHKVKNIIMYLILHLVLDKIITYVILFCYRHFSLVPLIINQC